MRTSTPAVRISPKRLELLLRGVYQATIVTIEARTKPRLMARHPLNGRPNPYRGATKVATVNGMLCWRYSRAVNRQRGREERTPDFQALPRAWGVRLRGTPLVEHQGELYLELKVERVLHCRYESAGGKAIDAGDIEPYLRRRPPGASRQGLEREIVLRDYALANLVSVTFGSFRYVVRREAKRRSKRRVSRRP